MPFDGLLQWVSNNTRWKLDKNTGTI